MKQYKPLLIVFIGALYFFFDSVLIVLPSGLTTALMNKYSITATGLSFLVAIYFYSYSILQLPNGILIDIFGPKKIALAGISICTFALFIFSISNTYILACTARLLMGIGASAGYLVPMILAVQWLDKKYYVLAIGSIVFIECLGAIFGQSVIIYIYHILGLQKTMLLLTGLGIILFILVFLIVRDQVSENKKTKNINIMLGGLLHILKIKYYWLIAFCATLFWAPAALFASLWGINFIVINNQVSSLVASYMLMFVWVGIGIGGPLIGLLVKCFDHKLLHIFLLAMIGCLVSILIIYLCYSVFVLGLCLFFLGITCAAQVLTFGIIHDYAPKDIIATAFGFNNMAICLGNAVFQMAAGYLLDVFWQHVSYRGMRVYSLTSYKKMLLLMPICYFMIMSLIFILVRCNMLKPKYTY